MIAEAVLLSGTAVAAGAAGIYWLRQRFYVVPSAPAPVAEPPVPLPVKKPVRKRHEADHFGAHYYLGDLLESLDLAFKEFPAFRKADRESFLMYRRLGAAVASSKVFGYLHDTDFLFDGTAKMPAFGCVHFGQSADERKAEAEGNGDIYPASFAYFLKEQRPLNVQPSNTTTYRCGIVWTDRKGRNGTAFCGQFWVGIDSEGNVTALKYCSPRYTPLPHRSSKSARGFYRMAWDFPEPIVDFAKRHGTTPQNVAEVLFKIIAMFAVKSEYGLQVRVAKGKDRATFAIDMLRTPYFFADRDKTINENGNTVPILHIVRAHRRADGSVVKTHFRGLRKFTWNGYRVSIGVPDLHFTSALNWNVPVVPEQGSDPAEGLVSMEAIAGALDKHMSQEMGAREALREVRDDLGKPSVAEELDEYRGEKS